MTYSGKGNYIADNLAYASVLTMTIGGSVGLLFALPALKNNWKGAFTPLLFAEGLGLVLLGASESVDIANDSKPKVRDKLHASGLILIGVGFTSIGIANLINENKIPLSIGGITILTGSLCAGLADDIANIVKWD